MHRALDINEKSFGEDHPYVVESLSNLALFFEATNRPAEAVPLMRRLIEIGEKTYGVDHPNVAIRLNYLGMLLQKTNRLADAEPLYRRALEIDDKYLQGTTSSRL